MNQGLGGLFGPGSPLIQLAPFAMILVVILLHSLAMMIGSPGFNVFAGVFTGFLQAGALVMLVMCAGGVTLRELGENFSEAYEVIRRGETQKEVIVPLHGEIPKPRQPQPEERPSVPLEGGE
jgi:hypothetical protein